MAPKKKGKGKGKKDKGGGKGASHAARAHTPHAAHLAPCPRRACRDDTHVTRASPPFADKGEASGELSTEQLLSRATLRISSLEQQLLWREEKMAKALLSQKELKDKVALYHHDF